MMLLAFGLVILYCLITVNGDGITQNRLIQSHENDTISTNITFNTPRRLGAGTWLRRPHNTWIHRVRDFQGDNDKLLGVAVLLINGKPACTGSYLKTQTEGKYVLTAAHCVFATYDKISLSELGKFFSIDRDKYSVEFGVTKNKEGVKTHSVATCHVKDVRVNDEYPSEKKIPGSVTTVSDYAILELGGEHCNPPKGYPMVPFPNDIQYTLRAGYTATYNLKVYKEKRLSKMSEKEKKIATQLRINNEGPRTGIDKEVSLKPWGGDSGGPVFDEQYNIIGITTTAPETYRAVIKLSPEKIKSIKQFISKTDGISPLIPKCAESTTSSTECWSNCVAKKPPNNKCTATRDFAQPIRKLRCDEIMYTYNGKQKRYGWKHKWLCNGGETKAHFGLKNLMEMLYDEIEDEIEDENDDFYEEDDIEDDYYY